MPGNPREIPVTTYGSTSLLEADWSAETVRTGAVIIAAGDETAAVGLHDEGGAFTQRSRSPAVVAEKPSNSGSVAASEAMVAATLCTCWAERPKIAVSATLPWQNEAG